MIQIPHLDPLKPKPLEMSVLPYWLKAQKIEG